MTITARFRVSLAAALVWASLTTVATAQSGDGEIVAVHARVSFADLDLDTAAGAAALLNRLEEASRSLCGPRPGLARLIGARARLACMRGAIGDAVARVDKPLLTASFSERWGAAPVQYAMMDRE